jgi:hypothetical protein
VTQTNGAKPMSVSCMILNAATWANPAQPGGAYWYGQVKATQVVAKDAFDAVNNQIAFVP